MAVPEVCSASNCMAHSRLFVCWSTRPASFFQTLIKFIVKRQVYENLKTKGTMNSKAAAHAVWLHYFTASHDVFTAASCLKDSESWLMVPKLLHNFIWLTTYIFANTSGYLFKVSALLAVLQKQILRIGIRFGSQGFSSKLIGDPKISFDIKKKKRTNFSVKNKRLYNHWKKASWLPNLLIFPMFLLSPWVLWRKILKWYNLKIRRHPHLIKIFIQMWSKILLL